MVSCGMNGSPFQFVKQQLSDSSGRRHVVHRPAFPGALRHTVHHSYTGSGGDGVALVRTTAGREIASTTRIHARTQHVCAKWLSGQPSLLNHLLSQLVFFRSRLWLPRISTARVCDFDDGDVRVPHIVVLLPCLPVPFPNGTGTDNAHDPASHADDPANRAHDLRRKFEPICR